MIYLSNRANKKRLENLDQTEKIILKVDKLT